MRYALSSFLLGFCLSLSFWPPAAGQIHLTYAPAHDANSGFRLAVDDFVAQIKTGYGHYIARPHRNANEFVPAPVTVIKLRIAEMESSRPQVDYPLIDVPDGQFVWNFYSAPRDLWQTDEQKKANEAADPWGGGNDDDFGEGWITPETEGFGGGFGFGYADAQKHTPELKAIWKSEGLDSTTANLWLLEAPSFVGLANGLYALLQERLGIQFVHPKQTIYPKYPLPSDTHLITGQHIDSYHLPGLEGRFEGRPRFDKRGFHLHTQHPLEITEQLMNPEHPNALADVKQYIDWLARNGQNVLQYYMLRGLDMDAWGAHNAAFVDYAHSRGIVCGLKSSVHSIQQYAHQLTGRTNKLEKQKRQVDDNLDELFAADWDFLAIDLSKAEFLGEASDNMVALESYIYRRMKAQYGAKFFHSTHVINEENVGYGDEPDVDADRGNPHLPSPYRIADEAADSSGCLIHSVMFYTLWDTYAPTYGNHNLHFMRDAAMEHAKVHETWYFPESAYWITFDNSIPAYYMNYLHGRYTDIEFVDSIGLVGHSTFSSGWEWGYWLTDWSIARWSWHYGQDQDADYLLYARDSVDALSRLRDMVVDHGFDQTPAESPNERADTLIVGRFKKLMDLQNYYLHDLNLMRFMAAQTILDQVPPKYRTPYHPQPEYRYKTLYKEFGPEKLDSIEVYSLWQLEDFGNKSLKLLNELRWMVAAEANIDLQPVDYQVSKDDQGRIVYYQNHDICEGLDYANINYAANAYGNGFCFLACDSETKPDSSVYPADMHPRYRLMLELIDANELTALRALHRAKTLKYLLNERRRKLGAYSKADRQADDLLGKARALRAQARQIVDYRHAHLRYDQPLLTGKRKSVTAYQYGYLYIADELLFWKREEEQVRRHRFGPLFMNHWPIFRILGIRGGR